MAKPENQLTWHDMEIGNIVTEPGNAAVYRTGDWRSSKPLHQPERCIKCAVCYVFCPEGCIKQDEEGYFVPDLYYCKGCGICAHECPTRAIIMQEEEE